MGKFKTPEARLTNHEGMIIWQAALPHQGARNRDIKEFSKIRQFVRSLGKVDSSAGMKDRILCFDQFFGNAFGRFWI